MNKMKKLKNIDEQANEKKIKEIKELSSNLKEGFKHLLVRPRISMYLKALGFKFKWSEEHNSFLIPLQISIKESEGSEEKKKKQHRYLIMLQPRGLWLSMRVGLLGSNQIPDGKRGELMESLLMANSKKPEFSFSINEEGDIGFNEDIFLPALNFDVFMEEFLTIPQAINYFWSEIIPELKKVKKEEVSFLYT